MPMLDIRDRMSMRSFLPRSISGQISFFVAKVQRVFNVPVDMMLGKVVANMVVEYEWLPSHGEMKQCAMSVDDVIDFAMSMLGRNIVVQSTKNTNGSKGSILIGEVKGVNGGNIMKSVLCHQSLFSYMVYYYHSVPKVRVYEVKILAIKTKEKSITILPSASSTHRIGVLHMGHLWH